METQDDMIVYPDGYLFNRYPRQNRDQRISLYFEGREQKVGFRVDPEIGGGMLMSEWHNWDFSFAMEPTYISLNDAVEFLDENKELFIEFLESYEEEWDGKNNRGQWDRELSDKILELVEKFYCPNYDLAPEALPFEVQVAWGYAEEEEEKQV